MKEEDAGYVNRQAHTGILRQLVRTHSKHISSSATAANHSCGRSPKHHHQRAYPSCVRLALRSFFRMHPRLSDTEIKYSCAPPCLSSRNSKRNGIIRNTLIGHQGVRNGMRLLIILFHSILVTDWSAFCGSLPFSLGAAE